MNNKYQIQKAYDKLRRMKDRDVLSLVSNTNGWKVTDRLVMNRAMFVAPDGSIVASTSNKGTHEQLFKELLSIVSGVDYDNTDDPLYFDTAIYDLLKDYTRLKEWIRLNGGSNAVEQRCYAVLTNWNEGRPSNSQFSVFEDFVNMAYDNKKDYVIVFFGGDGFDVKMFEFKDYMPEDVMRIAKRYYTSGRIYEGLKKKRLKEGVTSGVDCVEALLQAMTNLTEAELNEAIEIVIDNPLVNEIAISTNAPAGPCFILRDGRYLYSPLEEVVHFDILCELLCGIYYVKIQDDNCDSYEHWLEENGFGCYDVPYEGNIMDYATDILGLVRANSGTIEGMETKLYFVIPPNISTKQVYAMWDFLDKFINEKDDGYQAFFINGANVRWHILCDPVETSSDEFINIVKRYLATGKKPLGEKLNKLNEVYPNKGESKKDFISRFMSVTKKEYPDIKQRYAVANSYWDRRDKVNEAYGYHYGDLDVAKKAENRARMSRSRGTGHFGTGFYMVGTFEPEKASGYGERACWEIDLDKYNMFKPRSNSQAYELHDALKELNGGMPTEYPTYEYFQENVFQPLYDKYIEPPVEEVQSFYGVDEDEAEDILYRQEQFVRENDSGDVMVGSNTLKKYLEDLQDELDFYGVLEVLGYDKEYRTLVDAISTEDIDSFWYDRGRLSDRLESLLNRQDDRRESLRRAIRDLKDIFYDKDVERAVEYALQSEDQEDSRSTVFMKSLGYEGVDVTHLNKEGEGLSGLDNFGYGSVVYDLKPGTYRKIKERDAK